MYQCRIVKYIWEDIDKTKPFKILEANIKLEFTPSAGLEITTESWFTGKLQRVIYSPAESNFTLVAEDELPSSDLEPEFLLEMLLNQGWVVSEK